MRLPAEGQRQGLVLAAKLLQPLARMETNVNQRNRAPWIKPVVKPLSAGSAEGVSFGRNPDGGTSTGTS
jgi:hypothetical protein